MKLCTTLLLTEANIKITTQYVGTCKSADIKDDILVVISIGVLSSYTYSMDS